MCGEPQPHAPSLTGSRPTEGVAKPNCCQSLQMWGRVSLLMSAAQSEIFPNTLTLVWVTAGASRWPASMQDPAFVGAEQQLQRASTAQGAPGSAPRDPGPAFAPSSGRGGGTWQWREQRQGSRKAGGCLSGFLGRKCLFCCLCDLRTWESRIHHQWGRTCKNSKSGRK